MNKKNVAINFNAPASIFFKFFFIKSSLNLNGAFKKNGILTKFNL
jgi:hypothetical protein